MVLSWLINRRNIFIRLKDFNFYVSVVSFFFTLHKVFELFHPYLHMFWAFANFVWHRFANSSQQKPVPCFEFQRISLPWHCWSCGPAFTCWAACLFSSKPICRYKEGSSYCEYTLNFSSWLELLLPPFTTGDIFKPYHTVLLAN